MVPRRSVLALALTLLSGLAFAMPAEAILSGRNGRIAFTSGRAAGDATAQILTVNPVNIGIIEGPFSIAGTQNRHASWSPDRTKLVFAAGTPGSLATEEYDLFVKDMVTGSITPLNGLLVGDELSSDHPAWSPDGTRIAYETQPADPGNDSTDRNIMVQTVNTLQPPVALADSANFELKPAWSPDSSEIYYAVSPTAPPTTQFDIVKKSSTASAATSPTGVATSATVDEYQPHISPEGNRICFTRQSTLSNTATADIIVADLPGLTNQRDISDDPTKGDINCAWSPDGFELVFSNGTFNTARLVTEEADDADNVPPLFALTDDPGSNDFDGNADWAPDASPDCPDVEATTPVNTPVTIQLECVDQGPVWERTDPNGFANTNPTNGTLDERNILTNPSTVLYTPNTGFNGTDTFEYSAFDDFGFGTDDGTVTVQVGETQQPPPPPGAKCLGLDATLVGTAGNDEIVGTPGDDVIASLAGSDRVQGGGGNDIICGGPQDDRLAGGAGRDRVGGGNGNDRVGGGGGNDRLAGNAGRDRVAGGNGNDRLSGGGQNDRLGGGAGRDRIKGAQGRDRLAGGGGRDRLNGGGGRDRCAGQGGTDTARSCERTTGIP